MKIKNIAGGLLAAAVCFTPAISQADNEIPRAIIEDCKNTAQLPDTGPNCQGQCVAAIHVCTDEQTGEETFSGVCLRKLQKTLEACFGV